jgi:uncharacterized membrane protein HdeD (DUF308 family)
MNTEKIRKQIERNQTLLLVSGILLTTYGVLRFILINPNLGINLKTQLPTILNGTEFIVFGIGLLIGWFLTKRNKDKIIDSELDELKKKKEKRKKHYNWGPRLK